jgi:opacity protein-like surface antigen
MKRSIVTLAVLLILSGAAFGQTDAAKMKPVFYAGGGLALPTSPSVFSDYWGMGYGFGGGIGIQITPYVEVIGKFCFNTFPFDADKFLADIGETGATIDGLDFRALEFGADVKYMFDTGPESPVAPFLVAGVGAANVKVTDVTITEDGETITVPLGDFSETKIALGIGGGLDYMFSPTAGLWVEGRYTIVTTEGESTGYLPLRAGIKLLFGE